MIPYGRQDICQADIDSVIEVMRSDFLTQGPVVPKFERAVALKCEAEYAVASNSATSSLHLACLALGLGRGDFFWTVPNTFVASANCGLYCGATVDFVDIDANTYNMSIDSLRVKLEVAEKNGLLPKIVIPVHFAGQSCEMHEIKKMSDKYGFRIIEDASHAIGGRYRGAPVGNCAYSDITIFSFHPVKVITSGEGGMALTSNIQLAEKMKLLRSHGITRDSQQMVAGSEGAWHYEQIELGYNYRMTDMGAALGLSQLNRLDDFINQRNLLARNYDARFTGLPVTTPKVHKDAYSSFHLYTVKLPEEIDKPTYRRIFDGMRNDGIGVNKHYAPVHLQPYYRDLGFNLGNFPVSERYAEQTITLPLHYGLSADEQGFVIDKVSQAAMPYVKPRRK